MQFIILSYIKESGYIPAEFPKVPAVPFLYSWQVPLNGDPMTHVSVNDTSDFSVIHRHDEGEFSSGQVIRTLYQGNASIDSQEIPFITSKYEPSAATLWIQWSAGWPNGLVFSGSPIYSNYIIPTHLWKDTLRLYLKPCWSQVTNEYHCPLSCRSKLLGSKQTIILSTFHVTNPGLD